MWDRIIDWAQAIPTDLAAGEVGALGIAIAAAIALLKMVGSEIKSRIEQLLKNNVQALAALGLGAGGFLLIEPARYAPFLSGCIVAGLCVWVSKVPPSWLSHERLRTRFGKPSAATIALLLFVPFYVGAHIVEDRLEERRWQRLLESEAEVLVAFVLPTDKRQEAIDDAMEHRTFNEIYKSLRDGFFDADPVVEVRPADDTIVASIDGSLDDYIDLKRRFPPEDRDREDLERRLAAVYRGQSPIDIVVTSKLRGDGENAVFDIRAYDIDYERGTNPDFPPTATYGIKLEGASFQQDEFDHRRVMLVAAAKLALYFLDDYAPLDAENGLTLTPAQEAQIWDFFADQFRMLSDQYDDYIAAADADWGGHRLARLPAPCADAQFTAAMERQYPDELCSTKLYVREWVAAYCPARPGDDAYCDSPAADRDAARYEASRDIFLENAERAIGGPER